MTCRFVSDVGRRRQGWPRETETPFRKQEAAAALGPGDSRSLNYFPIPPKW